MLLFPCWCRSEGKSGVFRITVSVSFNTRFLQSSHPDSDYIQELNDVRLRNTDMCTSSMQFASQ